MVQVSQILAYRKLLLVFALVSFTILMVYNSSSDLENNRNDFLTNLQTEEIEWDSTEYLGEHFLVSSSKCKMSNLNPFNKDAMKFMNPQPYHFCTKKKLLTFTTVVNNIARLHIDMDVAELYSDNLSCCYSNVTRKPDRLDPDKHVLFSYCQTFENNVILHASTIIVRCKDMNTQKQVYENAHAVITITEDVQKKLDNVDEKTKPINMMFVGIDSISRLNFIRSMPNTHNYVVKNQWVPLMGYNKVEDNTFPNVMAILTGMDFKTLNTKCKPNRVGFLDRCPILWKDFQKFGYTTSYAEDAAHINTFNFEKKGFVQPPTDYYWRSYTLASENLTKYDIDEMIYCTGPETAGERILNVAKNFAETFKDYPSFGFFWMNSFSHNHINSPSRMDDKVQKFLEELNTGGVLERDIVVFFSDHGIRFGDIRMTYAGWLEERLPFIYVSFPPWFREKFPDEYDNFQKNGNKLTSPYDLYMTLQHVLVLSGFDRRIVPSSACPKCKSLFQEVDHERSCEDVGVPQHWCTCTGYKEINLDNLVKKQLAQFILEKIDEIIDNNFIVCANYSIRKIISVSASEKLPYSKKSKFVLVKLETFPKAIFEATIAVNSNINNKRKYVLTGDISRLDFYSTHSECVKDAYLKKYCYCR